MHSSGVGFVLLQDLEGCGIAQRRGELTVLHVRDVPNSVGPQRQREPGVNENRPGAVEYRTIGAFGPAVLFRCVRRRQLVDDALLLEEGVEQLRRVFTAAVRSKGAQFLAR